MNGILLENINLDDRPVDVLIRDGRIARIAVPKSLGASFKGEHLDCRGKAVIPGLINMHTHAGMAMMRGLGEDIAFHEWIQRIWDVESHIDDEYVYMATKVACLEMIKTGTTCFNDQYWNIPAARKAINELGLRSFNSYVLLDNGDSDEVERQKAECLRLYEESLSWGPLNTFTLGIHAIYSVCEELILWGTHFAREHGLKIHLHLSETQKEVEDCKTLHGGMTPVEYLDSLGVLGPDVIAAHTLWLSDNDIEILGKHHVTCVHNVNSNLKLSSGYKFKAAELSAAGANVCIGTDGCASSNNLDMLEAMKTSALLQKAWRKDPTAMPLGVLLDTATANGAKALGLEAGVIKEGAIADLAIINLNSSFFMSSAPMLANLVYSAHSDCVESLIVNGRFVMRDRVVPGEDEILADARRIIRIFQSKLG